MHIEKFQAKTVKERRKYIDLSGIFVKKNYEAERKKQLTIGKKGSLELQKFLGRLSLIGNFPGKSLANANNIEPSGFFREKTLRSSAEKKTLTVGKRKKVEFSLSFKNF